MAILPSWLMPWREIQAASKKPNDQDRFKNPVSEFLIWGQNASHLKPWRQMLLLLLLAREMEGQR